MTRPRSSFRQTAWRAMLLSFALLIGGAGCAHETAIGPIYVKAPPPRAGLARVYLYRVDPQHSFSTVEIRIDGREPLEIFDEEYVTAELAEGTHDVAFRLKRRLGWPSGAWSQQRIKAQAGETIYFEIAVGISERSVDLARTSEIAGRAASGTAGEVVSMRREDERSALERLKFQHLHIR